VIFGSQHLMDCINKQWTSYFQTELQSFFSGPTQLTVSTCCLWHFWRIKLKLILLLAPVGRDAIFLCFQCRRVSRNKRIAIIQGLRHAGNWANTEVNCLIAFLQAWSKYVTINTACNNNALPTSPWQGILIRKWRMNHLSSIRSIHLSIANMFRSGMVLFLWFGKIVTIDWYIQSICLSDLWCRRSFRIWKGTFDIDKSQVEPIERGGLAFCKPREERLRQSACSSFTHTHRCRMRDRRGASSIKVHRRTRGRRQEERSRCCDLTARRVTPGSVSPVFCFSCVPCLLCSVSPLS